MGSQLKLHMLKVACVTESRSCNRLFLKETDSTHEVPFVDGLDGRCWLLHKSVSHLNAIRLTKSVMS